MIFIGKKHSDTKNVEEILKFSKTVSASNWKNFENAWEVKKTECENHIKWGLIICEMMTGFQIRPQSSNRITFDPIFVKNCRKWAKSGI